MSEVRNPKPRPPIRWGHVETEPMSVAPEVITALSEVARNYLTIAQNDRHNDPIIIARAVKELDRFRGDPAVDSFFARIKYLRDQEVLKQKIKTLAQRPIK
jgi:hypothetical protein